MNTITVENVNYHWEEINGKKCLVPEPTLKFNSINIKVGTKLVSNTGTITYMVCMMGDKFGAMRIVSSLYPDDIGKINGGVYNSLSGLIESLNMPGFKDWYNFV